MDFLSGDVALNAAKTGNLAMLKRYIEKKGGLRFPDFDGCEPLHLAASNGHVSCVVTLLERLVDPDAANMLKEEETPLHYAAAGGHPACIDALVKGGANVNAETSNMDTPLHFAAKRGHAECVAALVKAGANVEAEDWDGKTPREVGKGPSLPPHIWSAEAAATPDVPEDMPSPLAGEAAVPARSSMDVISGAAEAGDGDCAAPAVSNEQTPPPAASGKRLGRTPGSGQTKASAVRIFAGCKTEQDFIDGIVLDDAEREPGSRSKATPQKITGTNATAILRACNKRCTGKVEVLRKRLWELSQEEDFVGISHVFEKAGSSSGDGRDGGGKEEGGLPAAPPLTPMLQAIMDKCDNNRNRAMVMLADMMRELAVLGLPAGVDQ